MNNHNIDIEKKFILSSCSEISEICDSLCKQSGITYYNYVRLFKDGTRVTLYNDQLWTQFFLDESTKYGLIFEEEAGLIDKYILWDTTEKIVNSKLITIAREEYNIDHGFTIVSPSNSYIDFHYFASTRNNININNYYINNLSLLHRFIYYFIEKSESLIKVAYKNKIKLDGNTVNISDFNYFELTDMHKSILFKECDHFYLRGDYEDVNLTIREMECLANKFSGASIKEIGSKLKISPRTVETHINKAKIKLRCNTLNEITKIKKTQDWKKYLGL